MTEEIDSRGCSDAANLKLAIALGFVTQEEAEQIALRYAQRREQQQRLADQLRDHEHGRMDAPMAHAADEAA